MRNGRSIFVRGAAVPATLVFIALVAAAAAALQAIAPITRSTQLAATFSGMTATFDGSTPKSSTPTSDKKPAVDTQCEAGKITTIRIEGSKISTESTDCFDKSFADEQRRTTTPPKESTDKLG
jgi:hypothetical protein